MRIRVFPRSFFEARIGGDDAEILERFTVISINTPCLREKPPFSADLLTHPNLRVIYFDDVENPADPEQQNFQFMTANDAGAIIDFMLLPDWKRLMPDDYHTGRRILEYAERVAFGKKDWELLSLWYRRYLHDSEAAERCLPN